MKLQHGKKIISGSVIAAAGLMIGLSPLAGALPVWTQVQGAGNWEAAALSGDGQYGLAGSNGGRLYVIANNNTVTETQPAGNANKAWDSVAISNTGNRMLASDDDAVYLSKDAGTTWTNVNPAGVSASFRTVSVGGIGKTMLAGVDGGRLYRSVNGGATWTETQPAGNNDEDWWTSSISKDGKTMLAGVDGGRLYLSTDSGTTWNEARPAGNNDEAWRLSQVKNNGQTLMAGARGDFIYISTNGGTTWNQTNPVSGAQAWVTAAMSENGQDAITSDDSSRLYVTSNGGTSWTETQPDGNNNRFWYAQAMSNDGNEMLAGASSGHNLFAAGTIGDGSVAGVTTADSDGDGVADSVEDAAPNGGDANNDGIPDSLQPNVTSFINPVTSKTMTVGVDSTCLLSRVTAAKESTLSAQDSAYDYPAGLANFTAACGTNGFTATVNLFYYGLSDGSYTLRKYGTSYATVSGMTKQLATIGGQSALKVTYSVMDGSSLDSDGAANGTIVDPVGLATAASQLTNTGTNIVLTTAAAGILIGVATIGRLLPKSSRRV